MKCARLALIVAAMLGGTAVAQPLDRLTGRLLAFKSGIWVFDVAPPGQLPDAVALPFNLVAPASSGIDRLTPGWHPLLRVSPLPAGDIGQMLVDAAEAARARRPDRATPLLSRLADSADATVLTAAGSICLLMRDPTVELNKAHHVMKGTY